MLQGLCSNLALVEIMACGFQDFIPLEISYSVKFNLILRLSCIIPSGLVKHLETMLNIKSLKKNCIKTTKDNLNITHKSLSITHEFMHLVLEHLTKCTVTFISYVMDSDHMLGMGPERAEIIWNDMACSKGTTELYIFFFF